LRAGLKSKIDLVFANGFGEYVLPRDADVLAANIERRRRFDRDLAGLGFRPNIDQLKRRGFAGAFGPDERRAVVGRLSGWNEFSYSVVFFSFFFCTKDC